MSSRLLGASALVLSLCSWTDTARAGDLLETAAADGRFTTLAAALEAAHLVDTLRGEGPFTVFAPTDEAFAALPEGTLEALLTPGARADLTAVLTYHVASGSLGSAEVLARSGVETLNGQRAPIQVDDAGARIAGASLVVTDLRCDNGVIHVVDRVLLPELRDLTAVAADSGDLELLVAAVRAAGLAEALAGPGPFTVFAPTDDAFRALGRERLEGLLREENRQELARILGYHVIPGRVLAAEALGRGPVATLAGPPLALRLDGGRLTVAGARVLAADVPARNGVVHLIDRVLAPPAPEPQGRRVLGVYLEAPDQALASQLGIDRRSSLLVTGVVEGSGAAGAGIERFDVIVEVAGEPATRQALDRAKQRTRAGDTLALGVLRGGRRLHVDVAVGLERH